MQTINISLPKNLAKMIDGVVVREGYASRSEFVRALVRFYFTAEEKSGVELLTFKKLNLRSVEKDLRREGKYNEKFIKSVISGLSKSSAYVHR